MTSRVPSPPSGGKTLSIAVIGAGATGALCALELARAGHTVTIIDAGAPGNGSSSRSAACFREQWGTPSTVRGMVYARKYYDRWLELVGGDTPPIHHNGYLFLGTRQMDEIAVRERVAMQQEAGAAIEFLTRDEVHERFPFIQMGVGVTFATWGSNDGFLDHDRVYLEAIAAAKQIGVTTRFNAPVTGATIENDRIATLHIGDESIEVDLVVNATNAWASKVSELVGGTELPIVSRMRYLYFATLRRKVQWMNEEAIRAMPMVIGPNGAYSRPTPDGSLLQAWLHHEIGTAAPSLAEQDEIGQGFRFSDPASYGQAVTREIARWMPFAEEIGRLDAVASGFYADTLDHNPIIGYDPLRGNLIHVAGFSGHGLMHAPFSAAIVSGLVSAGENISQMELPDNCGTVDLTPYAVNRAFKAPEGMVI